MSKTSIIILGLITLLSFSCSSPKLRSDRDLLGLEGPVKAVETSFQEVGGSSEIAEVWNFDQEGRINSREIRVYKPFSFHPYFMLDGPGKEVFSYNGEGRIKFIDRSGEREEFFIRPGLRVFESERRNLQSLPLGKRSFERDYKGNLVAVKVIGPQDAFLEFLKVDNYKIGRPFEVVISVPDSQGELEQKRTDQYAKDGLILTQKGQRTLDEKGNWKIVTLETGAKWLRDLIYYEKTGENN